MASTFVQFRIDENGIPFSMKLEERSNGVDAIMAMREASSIAAQNGIADMTLDEINAEIAEARKE
jgi:DNA-damage-inducible protein J